MTVFTFQVIEVASGEYDADIAVLAAEAAKSVSERRKAPRTITAGTEEVVKTISGKWQSSTNRETQVQRPVFVQRKNWFTFVFTSVDYHIAGSTKLRRWSVFCFLYAISNIHYLVTIPSHCPHSSSEYPSNG